MRLILIVAIFTFMYSCQQNARTATESISSDTVATVKEAIVIEPKLLDTINDKMTGDSYIMSTMVEVVDKISKESMEITFTKPRKGKTFWMSIILNGGSRCIERGAEGNLLFRDSSRINVYNHFKFNCEPQFVEYFRGSYSNSKALGMLKSKPLAAIRIFTVSSALTVDLEEDEANLILKQINALDK